MPFYIVGKTKGYDMKKGQLLNSGIVRVVSTMGHTDCLAIGDAGLPVPRRTRRIDLALHQGVPGFIDTLETVLTELCVESAVIASELRELNPEMYRQLLQVLEQYEKTDRTIAVREVSHETFKEMLPQTKAVVRTGECSPYANIILYSGVVFS